MARITIEQIKEELSKDSWSLLSEEYQNLESEIIAECPEGHKVYSTWGKLRTKRECPVCKQNKYKENKLIIREKKKGENRIIGLDQATKVSGFSVFDGTELIYYGTFEATAADETDRIHQVRMWLISMIENWKPDLIGIEGIQYEQNFGVTTFQALARLQGVVMETCYEAGIPFKVCATNTWRAHCGVKGRTRSDKKASMQKLIKDWFDVSVSDDCADAIGIGKYVAEGHQKRTEVVNWE